MIGKNDLIIAHPGFTLRLCDATSIHDRWNKPQKGMENTMRSYEISSPRAAELYFNHSFVGAVATFIAAFASTVRRHKRVAARRRAAATGASEKRGLLERLDAWFSRQDQEARERYLAGARDVFDLERRIDAIDRGRARYY